MDIKKLQEPTLVIMAAGMGSRYGGLKQIDPVTDKGEIIMDFSLYDAMMAGFKKVVFVIKEEMEADFRALMDGGSGKHMDLAYAFQKIDDLPIDPATGAPFTVPEGREKPWGTGHAILACRDLVPGSFAVINADDYYGPGGFQLMYEFLSREGGTEDFCMIGYDLKNTITENGTVARGVCDVSKDGYLRHITERKAIRRVAEEDEAICFTEDDGATWMRIPEETPVSMNFWGYTQVMMEELADRFPAFLTQAQKEDPLKGEYLIPTVTDALIQEGKVDVTVLRSEDRWYGVTYKEDKESVVAALQSLKDKGLYPDQLWK